MKYILMFFLFASGVTNADSNELERKYLSELHMNLEGLRYLIGKAKLSKDINSEYKIDYQTIEREYDLLLEGLNTIVEAPRREPRNIYTSNDVVEGNYLN